MLRALVIFVVVAVVLFVALGQLGIVGPYEAALVVVLALMAAAFSGRVTRKSTST
jgi:hypothetical protein